MPKKSKKPIVWLTSYWKAKGLEKTKQYSIASKQPKDFTLEELSIFMPVAGGRILMTNREEFKEDWDRLIKTRARDIVEWVESIKADVALCCWCKSATEYKLNRCHRALVAYLLEDLRPDLDIRCDIENPAWPKPKG